MHAFAWLEFTISKTKTNDKTKNKYFVYAKGDSAATAHYFNEEDAHKTLTNIRRDSITTTVVLPNKQTMSSDIVGELPVSNTLSTAGKKVNIFKKFFVYPLMLFPIVIRKVTYKIWFNLLEGRLWTSTKRSSSKNEV